jgi:sterol desaturase/sphingolipid hydroxylase (fatty acid hydroxylase superfamily)
MSRAIVLATPVFFLLIVIEIAWARRLGRSVYRSNDAINSLSLGVLSQLTTLFNRSLSIGLYALVASHLAMTQWPTTAVWAWLLAIVFYDFCYYWNHRVGHECALFWAAHVVHHQSQYYNLSTALRQSASSSLLGWVFYLPMAIAGVPVGMFAIAAVVDLLYQFWIHTELVQRLGWFDRWFASPSNHRVHHAVNDRYVDRNYGGILMVWDRLFGTFVEESEPCVYGTRKPLDSWNPLWANLEVYVDLARKSWRTPRWSDKWRVWFRAPGCHAPVAPGEAAPPPFDIRKVRRYDPPVSMGTTVVAAVLLGIGIAATLFLLWTVDSLAHAWLFAGSLVACAALVAGGALLQSGIRHVQADAARATSGSPSPRAE